MHLFIERSPAFAIQYAVRSSKQACGKFAPLGRKFCLNKQYRNTCLFFTKHNTKKKKRPHIFKIIKHSFMVLFCVFVEAFGLPRPEGERQTIVGRPRVFESTYELNLRVDTYAASCKRWIGLRYLHDFHV